MGPFQERFAAAEAAIVAAVTRLEAARMDYGDLLAFAGELRSSRRTSAEKEVIAAERSLDEARSILSSLIAMRPLVVLDELRTALREALPESERLEALSLEAKNAHARLAAETDAAAVLAVLADKAATLASSRASHRQRALDIFERDNAEVLESARLRFEQKPETLEAVTA